MITDRWNGTPDNWNGGHPGDGKVYHKTAYVSDVRVTPFNEPNDIMAPTPIDQPDGCDVYYTQSTTTGVSQLWGCGGCLRCRSGRGDCVGACTLCAFFQGVDPTLCGACVVVWDPAEPGECHKWQKVTLQPTVDA